MFVSCHTWVKQILGVFQTHRYFLIEIPDVADLWNPSFLNLLLLVSVNLYWPLFWADSSFKVLSQCDTHSTKPADKSTGFSLLQPSFHAFMHSFRQSQALQTHQGKHKHQSLCSKDTCHSQYLFLGSWWQLQGSARHGGSIFPYVDPPKIVLPTLSYLAAIKGKGHHCYEHNVHTQGLFHSLFECRWVMGMMGTNYSL